ncbi:hypothetical protein HPP92_022323 [Vanilla planifolia]|uniref:C2H2-type domain-containing protein n=1 Tax=Vanilla planifolia TaxID=51239 RepID=A0A835PV53_VANPL|nr:hypothetical protein HPP92_022323 [Vanilla planifolia]
MEKQREKHGRYGKFCFGRGDPLPLGYSWLSRSYTCSFCKREFRSAQALGGHMNVHRRDRARLRQFSPPWEPSLGPNPNPNSKANYTINVPNLNMPPPSNLAEGDELSPVFHNFPSLISPLSFFSSSSSPASSAEDKGMFKVGLSLGDEEGDMDLELRLGYT